MFLLDEGRIEIFSTINGKGEQTRENFYGDARSCLPWPEALVAQWQEQSIYWPLRSCVIGSRYRSTLICTLLELTDRCIRAHTLFDRFSMSPHLD